jgi:hypothetical protein
MNLKTVSDMKAMLRHKGGPRPATGFVKTASTGMPSPRAVGVALGIMKAGPSNDDYRLAVRATRRDAATNEYIDRLRQITSDEIDVAVVGEILAEPPLASVASTERCRPLRPGSSVGHALGTAGTIGAFVEHKGRPSILSNSHVLTLWDRATMHDRIVQPGPLDDAGDANEVATLSSWMAMKDVNDVDAAVATLRTGVSYEYPRALGEPYATEEYLAASRPRSWKVGRTTGLTKGVVTSMSYDDLPVRFGDTVQYFDGQIELTGVDQPFCAGGDSGSLIMDSEDRPFGLLFACTETGTTYANRLDAVLRILDLKLLR